MDSTLDEVKIRQIGEDIITDAGKMYSALEKISSLIEGSKSFLDSESGDKLRKTFKENAEKFTEYKTFIQTYGEFLKGFSGNIVKYEDAISNAADSIPKI